MLGAGKIGRFHADTVAFRTPGAELAAVADVFEESARTVAEAAGAGRWTADPEDVLSDPSIDAVVIATPGPTHSELMIRAAEAGKQIFCEKPIALELEEIDRALEAVQRNGVKLQIGFQRRFDPSFLRMRQMIEQGGLGKLYMVHSRTRDPGLPPTEYLLSCGGLFRDTSVHDFDVVRWLSGSEAVEVYAAGAVLVDPLVEQAGDIDTALVTLRMANGVIATVDNSRQAVYGYDVRAEVFGSEGGAEVSEGQRTAVVHRGREGVCRDHVYWYIDRFREAYEEEIRAFVRCLREDVMPAATGRDGRAATVLGLAAQRSLLSGAPVQISEIDPARAGVTE